LLRFARHDHRFVQRHSRHVTAAFAVVPRPGVIHQNTPHHPRGHRDEVSTALPLNALHLDESQISLVDERCRLQSMTRTFTLHVPTREPVQFGVHKREKPVERVALTTAPRQQQLGRSGNLVAHASDSMPLIGTRSLRICQLVCSYAPLCPLFPPMGVRTEKAVSVGRGLAA